MNRPSLSRLSRLLAAGSIISGLVLASLPAPVSALPFVCFPTGFMRDGRELTAAQLGGAVTGTLDATGCDIGVYYNPTFVGDVDGAAISGARYFGVVVDGGDVDVRHSSISNIGDVPLSGSQHGIGIYYTSEHGVPATGTIDDNRVSRHQKGGIVATVGSSVEITNNTVTGIGPVDFIAQNGIQVSTGATALVTGNSIFNHDYTPRSFVSCGLLLFNAGGVRTGNNLYRDDESNVCNFGKGGGTYSPAP